MLLYCIQFEGDNYFGVSNQNLGNVIAINGGNPVTKSGTAKCSLIRSLRIRFADFHKLIYIYTYVLIQ